VKIASIFSDTTMTEDLSDSAGN